MGDLEPQNDHDRLIVLCRDLKYIRETLDEIEPVIKDCPLHISQFRQHIEDHKTAEQNRKEEQSKLQQKWLVIYGGIASIIAAIVSVIAPRFFR